ncbi:hypothetical protein OH146_10760 [Salinibacterium sp. SYSU T00001]|uniref:hypothetical protein n=1 Tax=Homoserinimonas sedimenticola TaxID=2986805 RepID=UPI0022359246|nr:hypothetical protein [Salinibacterium sedimenticola]MCW4386252.1 hypothetical protein [Salinibacterium sedimenticola]
MDMFAEMLGSYAIVVWVVVPALTLLLLYGVIRIGVARALRDHQLWMEKNRPDDLLSSVDKF